MAVGCLVLCLCTLSCKMQPNSDRHFVDNDPTKVYRLRLNPSPGSQYYYTISNETETHITAGEKKVDTRNRSNTGMLYAIARDSATGDYLFHMAYDKIHLSTKSDEQETEMDAARSADSPDPVEKMLGALTSTKLLARISPSGEVRRIDGYKEIAEKILAQFNNPDENARLIARNRLDQLSGSGLVQRDLEQLFRIFPDSAIHVGDRWKLNTRQKAALNVDIQNSFTLTGIRDSVALIRARAEISSDNGATTNLMGYTVTTNLKGSQESEYEMDANTGMLLAATVSARLEGTLQLMGRDLPVKIRMEMKMVGKKVK